MDLNFKISGHVIGVSCETGSVRTDREWPFTGYLGERSKWGLFFRTGDNHNLLNSTATLDASGAAFLRHTFKSPLLFRALWPNEVDKELGAELAKKGLASVIEVACPLEISVLISDSGKVIEASIRSTGEFQHPRNVKGVVLEGIFNFALKFNRGNTNLEFNVPKPNFLGGENCTVELSDKIWGQLLEEIEADLKALIEKVLFKICTYSKDLRNHALTMQELGMYTPQPEPLVGSHANNVVSRRAALRDADRAGLL